jgi:hypothetical protein
MTLKKGFIYRDILNSNHPFSQFKVNNPVYHQKGITVGKDSRDVFVKQWKFQH